MKLKGYTGCILAGLCAGAVNGLFGSGGGMVLVPLLTLWADLKEDEVFPASVCIILPICIISLVICWQAGPPDFKTALPYLLGSAVGGVAAGIFGKRLPTLWLHRFLGLLILIGGVRYLWGG